jgi:hypothetical protein
MPDTGTEFDEIPNETERPSDKGKTTPLGYDTLAVKYLVRARRVLSLEGAEALPQVEHILGVARVYAVLELADAVRLAEESWSQSRLAAADSVPEQRERS